MNQSRFKKLVSDVSGDWVANTLRFLLNVLAVFYEIGIALRNWLYDKRLAKSYAVTSAGLKTTDRTQATVPVLSIGNITVGGTGKTPLVIWLVRYLAKQCRPAILTRGYKSKQGISDEASLLARAYPRIPVIINPDRIKGANEAVAQGANVLVMDDGFQHRRLARDLDIIAIDATCPFGYGRLLPAGLLREPLRSLKRADAVIITRADQAEKNRLNEIERTVKAIKPSLVVATAIHKPVSLVDNHGAELQLTYIKNKKVFTFCGIGNPDAFLSTLKSLGATVAGSAFYEDHYHYSKADIEQLAANTKATNADLALTTEKDFSKIDPAWPKNLSVDFSYLAVEIELRSGAERITQLINNAIAGKISTSS